MEETLIKHSKKNFEDLEVWKLGIQLFINISQIFGNEKFKDYYFKDQILRATLSISNNIAEGYERQSNRELIRFLYISKGSCGEVRSMLHLAEQQGFIDSEKSKELRLNCVTISVKISNFIKYLSNNL